LLLIFIYFATHSNERSIIIRQIPYQNKIWQKHLPPEKKITHSGTTT